MIYVNLFADERTSNWYKDFPNEDLHRLLTAGNNKIRNVVSNELGREM